MFHQKIPIKIPQGTHGLQPELALEYDPNLGNGIVGVGWQLTGLSTVTRVNFGNGVNYAGNDTYAHSTLGVLVPQSDGSYRSKNESFVRLVPSGTCGDGPCSWVATDRSGVKFFYGSTADSQLRQYGMAPAPVRTWALSMVLDLFGNYYKISYSDRGVAGLYELVLYPHAISYTNGPANPSLRSISFDYESRSDIECRRSAATGIGTCTRDRLKWISVFSAGTLVRKYRLDYEYNTALTGRSHLIALQEYGSDGVSTLPAQTFGWQQGGIGFQPHTLSTPVADPQTGAATRLVGDFNGDGKMDLATVFNDAGGISIDVRISQGGSFVTQRWATQQGGWIEGDSWQSWGTFLAGDFNGDGKTDIAYVFNDNDGISLDVHLSNGSAFVLQRWATQQGGWMGGTSWQNKGLFLAGDFNGDGKSDIAYVFNDGGLISIDVHAAAASSFVLQRWTTNDGSWVGGDDWQSRSTFLSGDFDGDGRMDIAYVYWGINGQRNIDVYRSAGIATADSFYSEQWASSFQWDPPPFRAWFGGYAWKNNSTYLTGDFNGDGKTDIAYVFNDNNGISIEVETASGGWFDVSRWASQQGGWIGGSDWRSKATFLAGDFDGDGKTDIGYAFLDSNDQYISVDVHAARPEGFVLQRWATNCARSMGYTDWQQNAIFLAADFDGDGRTDIAQFDHAPAAVWGLRLFRSPNPSPDLMTTVNNGIGGTVTVSYAPAPQVQNAILPSSSGPGIPLTAPQQLVTSVVTTDGDGGSYSTHYDYMDVRWSPGPISSQRYLGFSSTSVTDDQTSQSTRTTYYQTPGYERHPWLTASYSSSGQIVDLASFGYDLVYPSTGTELVRTRQIAKGTFENGTVVTSQVTSLSDYDAYGNAKTATTTSDNLPSVTVTTNYANDAAQWILGRVTDVTTSSGETTLARMTNTWTGNLLTQRSDWLDTSNSWLDTTLEYYPDGDLKSVTQPSSDGLVRKTTTTYDPTFQAYPYTVTNALGHMTKMTYDSAGLPLTVTDPNGQVTSTTYDVFGRKSHETRPDGGTTDYSYIDYGTLGSQYNQTIVKTSSSGASISKRDYFDGSGFVFRSIMDGDGGPVYRETFKDLAGRISFVTDPFFSLTSMQYTHFTYDAAGRIATKTASDGTITTFEYGVGYSAVIDPNGRKTTTYFDMKGRTSRVVDAADQAVTYGYDALDRPASVTLADGSVTQVTFDSLGRRTSVVDPKLGTTDILYDASGNVFLTWENGNNTTFGFDALNRMTSKLTWDPTWSLVTYAYDDPAIAYGKGRLTSVTGPNESTTYSYKPNGMLNGYVRTVDGATYSQTFTYDLLGRVTRGTYPDASIVDYRYTTAGNLEQVSLNGALVASWSNYNVAGQPRNVTFGNGVASALQYDAGYHVSTLKTTNGSATLQDLTYDWYSRPNTNGLNLGAITDNRASKTVAGANTDESQTFSYDPLYRLREATGVWGTKSYLFDALGNATSFGGLVDRTLNYNGPLLTSGTGLSNVSYNGVGDMTRKVLDGTTWDYGWNAHQLETVTKNGTQVGRISYDSDGQRLKSVITPAGAPAMTALYIGKVYEKRTFDDGSPERHTLHVYANGQLISSVTRSGHVATAFNDANSWRNELAAASMYSSTSVRGAALKVSHLFLALTTHPHFGRWVSLAELVALAAAAIALFLRTLLRAGKPSRWSPVLRFGSMAVLLCFGSSACTSPGGTSPGGTLGQESSALLSGDAAHGPAVGTYYYHSNHIQSTSVVTDASGNEVSRIVYLPFGEVSPANSAGTDTVTAKFTGQEYDDSFGLYYYNARYYDPALGRFLSPDSIVPDPGNLQSFNRYSYVMNNPVNFTDPSGHSAWSSFTNWWSNNWKTVVSVAAVVVSVAMIALGVGVLLSSAIYSMVAGALGSVGIAAGSAGTLGGTLIASGIGGVMTGGLMIGGPLGGDGSGGDPYKGSTTNDAGGKYEGDGISISTSYSASGGGGGDVAARPPQQMGLKIGLWTELWYRNTLELSRLQLAIEELNEPGCACALRGGYGWASAPWDNRVIVLQLAPWVGWKGSNGWTDPAGIIFVDPNAPNYVNTIAHEAGHFRWPFLGHSNPRRFRADGICGVSKDPDFWKLEGLDLGACSWAK